jgi:hypothetical protein
MLASCPNKEHVAFQAFYQAFELCNNKIHDENGFEPGQQLLCACAIMCALSGKDNFDTALLPHECPKFLLAIYLSSNYDGPTRLLALKTLANLAIDHPTILQVEGIQTIIQKSLERGAGNPMGRRGSVGAHNTSKTKALLAASSFAVHATRRSYDFFTDFEAVDILAANFNVTDKNWDIAIHCATALFYILTNIDHESNAFDVYERSLKRGDVPGVMQQVVKILKVPSPKLLMFAAAFVWSLSRNHAMGCWFISAGVLDLIVGWISAMMMYEAKDNQTSCLGKFGEHVGKLTQQNRIFFQEMMLAALSVLTHDCVDIHPNPKGALLISSGAIDVLVDILSVTNPGYDFAKQLAIHSIWVAAVKDQRVQEYAMKMGITRKLMRISGSVATSDALRFVTCKAFRGITDGLDLDDTTNKLEGDGEEPHVSFEETMIKLLQGDLYKAQEYGASVLASLSTSLKMKKAITQHGGVEALVDLLLSSDDESHLTTKICHTLLNLSGLKVNQAVLARHALKRFVSIARGGVPASVFAQGILSNLGRHECNRTPLYKAALKVIIQDAKKEMAKTAAKQLTMSPINRPQSTLSRTIDDKDDPFCPVSPKTRKDRQRLIEMTDTKLEFDNWFQEHANPVQNIMSPSPVQKVLSPSQSLPLLGAEILRTGTPDRLNIHSRSSHKSFTRDMHCSVKARSTRSPSRSLERHERKGYLNNSSSYINNSLRKNGFTTSSEQSKSPWLPEINEWKFSSKPSNSLFATDDRPHTVKVSPNRNFEFHQANDFASMANMDKDKERQRALNPSSSDFRLWEFKHVEGSKYAKDLFKQYEMPDGKVAYYFQVSRLIEAGADGEEHAAPGKLVRFSEVHSTQLVLEVSRLVVQRHDVPAFDRLLNLEPHPAPSTGGGKKETDRIPPDELHMHLRFEMPKVVVAVPKEKEKVVIFVPKDPWTLPKSIWVPRLKESEAKDFFDNPRIFCRSFCIDWSRCIEKRSFLNVISKFSKKLKLNDAEQKKYNEDALAATKDVLFKYYETTSNMFNYVAANSGFMGGKVAYGSLLSFHGASSCVALLVMSLTPHLLPFLLSPHCQGCTIALNAYTTFCEDCEIAEEVGLCNTSSLDTLFIGMHTLYLTRYAFVVSTQAN